MTHLGIGLIGAGFIADLHAEALRRVPDATVRVVAARDEGRARAFAADRGIPDATGDWRWVLERSDVDVVCICVPNHLHREVTVAAAQAGKHVICEKPLARTLADADAMIAACAAAGVRLMYGEMICFAPKYVRAKALIDEGALGRVFQIKHGEQHFGPHSAWFWDGAQSGGGVMMDMGCHGVEVIRWMYGRPQIESVTAELGTYVHGERTDLDDHANVVIRFAGNRVGIIETSWAKPGGMHDSIEILGSGGVTYADLLRGSSLLTYSETGYGYAVEKAGDTRGWTHTIYEETWNYGFPQELAHFVDCVLRDREPLVTAADGRVVLEAVYAAYRSAGTGQRVMFPLELSEAERAASPIELWRAPARA